MASAQVVETSVNTNSSPSQDYTTNPEDHSNHNTIYYNCNLNTARAYIWNLRVSTCQSSLFSKHCIGWKQWEFFSREQCRKLGYRCCFASEVILCCCEMTFSIIAELTCITFSLIWWLSRHFFRYAKSFVYIKYITIAQKLLWTVDTCIVYTRSAKPVTTYACVGGTSKSARNANDVRTTTTLDIVWTSPWHLLEISSF